MTPQGTASICPFDTLLTKNVPHILEKIFLSLDYKSFKECLGVNISWKRLLTSDFFQVKAKVVFHDEILEEQRELWQAAMWGKVDVAKRILSRSHVMVDVNCLGGFNDSTPLGEAASFGHEEVAKLLLQKGAYPNKVDKCGQTPLYWAATSRHKGGPGVIKILLEGGADPNRVVVGGTSLLHQVAMKGQKNLVALLLAKGADPRSVDRRNLLEFEDKSWLEFNCQRYQRIPDTIIRCQVLDKEEYNRKELLHKKRVEICKMLDEHKLSKIDPSLICEAMKKKTKRSVKYRYTLKKCVNRRVKYRYTLKKCVHRK